jgi:CheY-like chemotaxis protein
LNAAATRSLALVVDPLASSRNSLSAALRELGIDSVEGCSQLQEARRRIERKAYDLVLCEQSFPGEAATGNDLLEDLRQTGLLPLTTLFIIVSAQATHDSVTEAAESSLDGYLLKPYTAASLAERIRHAQKRKRTLMDISSAIARGDLATAAQHCIKRVAKRELFWMYSARVGTELLLRMNRTDEAMRLLQAVAGFKAVPWVHLAMARVNLQIGRTKPAIEGLRRLVDDEPHHVDALDILAQALCEQGEFEAALEIYRRAVNLTPHSTPRLQRHGMWALYLGRHQDALHSLERSITVGGQSKMFDPQVLTAMALMHLLAHDGMALKQCIDRLEQRLQSAAQDERLKALLSVARCAGLSLAGQTEHQQSEIRRLEQLTASSDFTVDLACLVVKLLALSKDMPSPVNDALPWALRLGQRFCVSHGSGELLLACSAGHQALQKTLRDAQLDIMAKAEGAMKHTVAGQPDLTARTLINGGRETGNAKLIELANAVLTTHANRIDDLHALQAQARDLKHLYGQLAAMPTLACDIGRSPGSIVLRTPAPARQPAQAMA